MDGDKLYIRLWLIWMVILAGGIMYMLSRTSRRFSGTPLMRVCATSRVTDRHQSESAAPVVNGHDQAPPDRNGSLRTIPTVSTRAMNHQEVTLYYRSSTR